MNGSGGVRSRGSSEAKSTGLRYRMLRVTIAMAYEGLTESKQEDGVSADVMMAMMR